MKILCLSDIHDQFDDYKPSELPDADIVFLAGDITDLGVRGEVRGLGTMQTAAAWLRAMGDRYSGVFWIPGNHDIGVNSRTFEDIPNILCVLDKTVKVGPFSLTGVSLTPCFAQPSLKLAWDYMTDDPGIDAAAFDLPPVDIVLSHGPPKGVLDGPGRWDRPACSIMSWDIIHALWSAGISTKRAAGRQKSEKLQSLTPPAVRF